METTNEQQGLQVTNKEEQALQNATTNEDVRLRLQNFTQKLNAQPKPESIGSTPDGRAKTIKISHIETTLDEYFFGMWTTENFRWSQIGNEVVGSIDLKVLHPVAGVWITRQGAASIIIMVDKAPDNITGKDKNLWALDMQNKKSNALDMGFPKLKAECLKNAANSFGSMFGRDLNRKEQDRDTYTPLFRTKPQPTTDGAATNTAA